MDVVNAEGQPYSRYGSTVHKQIYLYGNLEPGPTVLHRTFGMAWSVSGWVLSNFLRDVGPEQTASMARRIAANITTTFATEFFDTIGLADLVNPHRAGQFLRLASGQKYLIQPYRS